MRRLEFHISKVTRAALVSASVFLLSVTAQCVPTLSITWVLGGFN